MSCLELEPLVAIEPYLREKEINSIPKNKLASYSGIALTNEMCDLIYICNVCICIIVSYDMTHEEVN